VSRLKLKFFLLFFSRVDLEGIVLIGQKRIHRRHIKNSFKRKIMREKLKKLPLIWRNILVTPEIVISKNH
jgi:hypothetical protein